MIEVERQRDRGAFAWWLRTGRLPPVRTRDGVELKFNPYHDPADGRFTFAPGGGASGAARLRPARPRATRLAAGPAEPMRSGGNARAFFDPMTLAEAMPALRNAPGGAIVAIADNFLNFTGPATEAKAALLDNWSRQVIADIRSLDPHWHQDTLGAATTIEGKINELNGLRFERAAVVLRVKGDIRPLQVETIRFVQRQADTAYIDGLRQLRAGRLKVRLSEQEALGNFIDRQVRADLRLRYTRFQIDSAGKGPVRVNRREDDKSGTDLTYRRPDARIGNMALDVTLTRKTLSTPQVRGFFATDFRPNHVVIIRPSQIGAEPSYVITQPGSGGR